MLQSLLQRPFFPTSSFYVAATLEKKVNQSHYRPEVPREFKEVKVPGLHGNGPGWW